MPEAVVVADEINRLPKDISELGQEGFRHARDARDERLSILFRRWPALTKIEMREIRQLHDERQRLAAYMGLRRNLGTLRRRRRAESGRT
jgi:hypothetical protein